METPNFLIWAVVVFSIAGFAIISMVNASRTPITVLPFPDAVIDLPSMPLSEAAMATFVSAIATYKAGCYQSAISQMMQVIEQEPSCAEAWHNMGLAYANVGDNDKAVRSLLKASDAYSQHKTKSGIERLKQDLATLKAQG
jgi:tetratricopeptide (TPR) repeat protein